MGSAATCCTHIVPGEVIKGKDEILSRNQEDNHISNNNIINGMDVSSKSIDSHTNNNKNQENSNNHQNISDLEKKYVIEALENETNIMKDSLAMIALFHLNYWCESEEEKKEIEALLEENETKNKEARKETYDLQKVLGKDKDSMNKNTFANHDSEINQLKHTEEKSLAKKENFLTRIIKKLFHKS